MTKFLFRTVTSAFMLWLTSLLPGIQVFDKLTIGDSPIMTSIIAYLILGLIFAAINSLVRPILQILALPITIVTLGIFYFIVNAGLLFLLALISRYTPVEYYIDSFMWGLLASLIISCGNSILTKIFNKNRQRKEVEER